MKSLGILTAALLAMILVSTPAALAALPPGTTFTTGETQFESPPLDRHTIVFTNPGAHYLFTL